MGAAASLASAGLPEKLSRADVKQLSDHKYTDEQFNALCDEDGFITSEQFVQQVVAEQEAECERLFLSFCHHDDKGVNLGYMDEQHLVAFLRHCRLLSKGQFSVHHARDIFRQLSSGQEAATGANTETETDTVTETETETDKKSAAKEEAEPQKEEVEPGKEEVESGKEEVEPGKEPRCEAETVTEAGVSAGQTGGVITYSMFREGVLPKLAAKKGLHMDRVMFLLSRCEANTKMVMGELVVTDTYVASEDAKESVEREVHILVHEKEEEEKQKRLQSQANATRIIQGAARKKNARQKRDRYLSVRRESMREDLEGCFCTEDYGAELEDRLKKKFYAFASHISKEMDMKQFQRWLVDCGWYITQRSFTRGDAEVVFKKAMARASVLAAGLDLNLGVVMGKRVRFVVFRKAVVKVLAEEVNLQTNDIMFALVDVDDPA